MRILRLWPWAVFTVLIACAAYAHFLKQPQQQGPRVKPQQEAAQGVGGNQNANQTPPAHEGPSGKPQETSNGNHAEDREIFGVKPGEWLLVLATLLLWYATMRLVWDARETARRQLRAYVGTERVYFGNDDNDGPISVMVEIENFGNSPAYDFQTSLHLQEDHSDFFGSLPTERRQFPTAGGKPLMPRGKAFTICTLNIKRSVLDYRHDLRQSKFALYLTGVIFYRDIFGDEHQTYVRLRAKGPRIDTRSQFVVAEVGNEAD